MTISLNPCETIAAAKPNILWALFCIAGVATTVPRRTEMATPIDDGFVGMLIAEWSGRILERRFTV